MSDIPNPRPKGRPRILPIPKELKYLVLVIYVNIIKENVMGINLVSIVKINH